MCVPKGKCHFKELPSGSLENTKVVCTYGCDLSTNLIFCRYLQVLSKQHCLGLLLLQEGKYIDIN